MPTLDSPLHLDMYRTGQKNRRLPARVKQALKILLGRGNVYGLEWGDPDTSPPLAYIKDHFLLPYMTGATTAIEIGPGGGRWTRYMLGVQRLYAVDFHQELLNELKSNFAFPNVMFVKNNGDDFPGIPNESVDFIFSFGTFVHLDIEIIERYLQSMRALLKPQANVVIQYADKSKPLGRANQGFSENHPELMRRTVSSQGYFIYEEDVQTLWHSSVIRFGIRDAGR